MEGQKYAHVLVWMACFKNWKKNIISKVPKDGDLKDYIFQALKATMYKSIEYEKNIEDFVGCTWETLLMTIVEDFGGVGFHNYFWAPYWAHWIFKSGKGKKKWFKACKDASLFFRKLKNSYQDSICVQGDFNQRNLEF